MQRKKTYLSMMRRRLLPVKIKILAAFGLMLFFGSTVFGQIKKMDIETTAQFAKRLAPENSVIVHQVLSVKWNARDAIVAFYEQGYKLSVDEDPDQQDYKRIIATIFIQSAANEFHKYLIDTIDEEGSAPVIESVFFANADKDAGKELIMIVSWQQKHKDVEGILYGTMVYDDNIPDGKDRIVLLKKISEKLSGGCECEWSDGRSRKARFKKAEDIRKELQRLGYHN